MDLTHTLFDFDNTYLELSSLQQQIEEFQTTYQSNIEIISFDNEVEQDFYNQEKFNELDISNSSILNESILEESILNESILTDKQIDKFKKIYLNNKIEDSEDDNNLIQNITKNIDKKNEEAQYKKLQTIICLYPQKNSESLENTENSEDLEESTFWNSFRNALIVNKHGQDGKTRILSIIADQFTYKQLRKNFSKCKTTWHQRNAERHETVPVNDKQKAPETTKRSTINDELYLQTSTKNDDKK
ncbi:25374_t:CDS:2, partial [Gigaspora rosea]